MSFRLLAYFIFITTNTIYPTLYFKYNFITALENIGTLISKAS